MRNLVLDVDGVFTDGTFLYSSKGKSFKTFGADDHDALNVIRGVLSISVITADSKGYKISKKRIAKDMSLPMFFVPAVGRVGWISERMNPSETIYMGDGILDVSVFRKVGYSICTRSALDAVQQQADYVTSRRGGDRAIAEACLHLAQKFFYDDSLFDL